VPTPHRDRILAQLARDQESEPDLKLFAILDAARDPSIHGELKASSYKSSCLYKGAPLELELVAPWLVAFEGAGGAYLESLVERGWGEHWAIYLLANASLGELRKHFRRFLQVYREDGRKLYFRFGDPRVTRSYLPTCTKDELDFVMGPVSQILLAGDDPETLLRYTLDEEEGLDLEVVHFAEDSGDPAAASLAEQEPAQEDLPPEVATVLADMQASNGGGPQSIEQVRDVLAIHPGHPALLGFLRGLGAQRYEGACEGALPLRELLADLRTTRFSPTELEPSLRSYPERGSWKAAYVALAPAFEGWLPGADRAALLAGSQVLVDVAAFAQDAQDQRTKLRQVQELKDPLEEANALKAALGVLKGMQAKSAAWSAPEEDPTLARARKGIERVLKRAEGRLSARSLVSGLSSLLVSLRAHDRETSVERVARGVIAALASTLAADGSASASPVAEPPPAEPAPVEREGRYTMRRKALPFQTKRLVIREEQMAGMAVAMQRNLLTRLVAHVRDEHPPCWGAKSPQRLRTIAEKALHTASTHRIQKVPAITILLDIMITIDPEFTELDEYEWAQEILESDMLEPNSKPELILEQMEG
jgi:hypothetical protein